MFLVGDVSERIFFVHRRMIVGCFLTFIFFIKEFHKKKVKEHHKMLFHFTTIKLHLQSGNRFVETRDDINSLIHHTVDNLFSGLNIGNSSGDLEKKNPR